MLQYKQVKSKGERECLKSFKRAWAQVMVSIKPELAKLAYHRTISLLERDEYTPSVVIALKISQIFNEPVESVFRIEEDE